MQVSLVTDYDGEWQGLYINGKLIVEDHKVTTRDMGEAINEKDKNIYFEHLELDPSYLKNVQNLPEYLDEIPNNVFVTLY
ncbi:MAG: hypothetical protein WC967_12030 [Balneolaceae bacterium]